MNRRDFTLLLSSAMAAAWSLRAQQKAIPVIGWLNSASLGQIDAYLAAFRQGLAETGYVEGQNVSIEYRWAEYHYDRLPGLAAQLVGREAKVIALLVNPTFPQTGATIRDMQEAARVKGVALPVLKASSESETDAAFASLAELRADGLVVEGNPFFEGHREQLITLAVRQAVPAIYSRRVYTEAGGLISYGSSLTAIHREIGIYVGKILNGAKPADLPVQQPTKFELVVNLKTAQALGLTIPPSILLRADEVIE